MFSTLMLDRRLPMVPVLSSAANMPFPGVAMYLAFFISSSAQNQRVELVELLTSIKNDCLINYMPTSFLVKKIAWLFLNFPG